MEDNNNIDTTVVPETIDPKVPYIELDPENELNFVEADTANAHVHSSSAIDSHGTGSAALSHAFLKVTNVSEKAVLFKIQTTSPIHYRVKPSHGRIEVGETREIQISMLSESKKSDKFLINAITTFYPSDCPQDFNYQFSTSGTDEYVQKYRLKCVIPGSSGNGLLAATGGNGSTGSISSPVAPSLQATFAAGAADSMASINSEKSVLAVQRSPSNSVATLQRELKEAQAEIERLRSKPSAVVAKEWKDVLTAQYGAPPVLVLLVAIFAFMIGLLF